MGACNSSALLITLPEGLPTSYRAPAAGFDEPGSSNALLLEQVVGGGTLGAVYQQIAAHLAAPNNQLWTRWVVQPFVTGYNFSESKSLLSGMQPPCTTGSSLLFEERDDGSGIDYVKEVVTMVYHMPPTTFKSDMWNGDGTRRPVAAVRNDSEREPQVDKVLRGQLNGVVYAIRGYLTGYADPATHFDQESAQPPEANRVRLTAGVDVACLANVLVRVDVVTLFPPAKD
jgi:hypothetical protein